MNKLYYSSVASGKAPEHRFGEFMLMRQHGKQGRDGNGYGISSQDQSGRSAQSQSFGEEMECIIHDSEKKKEKDSNYFVWGTLIIMGVLIAIAVILWAVFIK